MTNAILSLLEPLPAGTYILTPLAAPVPTPAVPQPAPTPQPAPAPQSTLNYEHWLQSNNIDGGHDNNAGEIAALARAVKAGAPWKGYVLLYTWRALEPAYGQYAFETTICAHVQALWKVLPNFPVGVMILPESYAGKTAQSCGTPDFILAAPQTYGPGTDGQHGGYAAFSFANDPVTKTPVQSGGTAAVWRALVMNELIALWETLSRTSIDPAHPDVTFGNTLAVVAGGESSLSFLPPAPSDYSDTALGYEIQALTARWRQVFPHALACPMNNYLNHQTNTALLLAGTLSVGAALAGPDCYVEAHLDWFQAAFSGLQWNGTAWVPGGTDCRGKYPCVASIQQETIAKYRAASTPAKSLTAAQAIGATRMWWCYLTAADDPTGGAYAFPALSEFISTHPL